MRISLNQLATIAVLMFLAFKLIDTVFDDTSTSLPQTNPEYYIDATGTQVSLSDYTGNYLWVDYAAEWCSYCEPQTRTLQGVERHYGDRIVFLTVITGTEKVMESPSASTAMKWVKRFNLDPYRVLAKFSTNTLPYHVLYSPSGEILHQSSGLYSASMITGILKTHISLLD